MGSLTLTFTNEELKMLYSRCEMKDENSDSVKRNKRILEMSVQLINQCYSDLQRVLDYPNLDMCII
jgi:hypothetical protein